MIQKLYKYNQYQNIKTSIDIGEITPIYWNHLYPGEKIENFGYKNLTRMITPIYPTLDNARFNLYAFAVPKRLLYGNDYTDKILKANLISDTKNPLLIHHDAFNIYRLINLKITELERKWQSSSEQRAKAQKLAIIRLFIENEYLGGAANYKDNPESIEKINRDRLPREPRFYNKYPGRFENYFINNTAVSRYSVSGVISEKFGINLHENENKTITAPGTSRNSDGNNILDLSYWLCYWKIYNDFFKNKKLEKFDYQKFYNALTNDSNYFEIGKVLELSKLDEKIEKIFNENIDSFLISGNEADKNYVNTFIEKFKSDAELNQSVRALQALSFLNNLAMANVDNDLLNSFTFEKVKTDLKSDWNLFKKELSENYIKNNKVLKGIKNGTVKDVLIKLWNVDNNDRTNVKLLGYDTFEQTIQNVINQSASNDSKYLGEVGGMSLTYNSGALINSYEAKEETYIMVLAVPTYKLLIKDYIDPYEFRAKSEFNPFVEYVQEPITAEEINSKFDYDKNIIGYVSPFDYMRQKPDIVAGEIRNNWKNWSYIIDFDLSNGIDLSHLKLRKKPFKDTLVSPNQDAFITDFGFHGDFYRVIKPKALIEEEVLTGK